MGITFLARFANHSRVFPVREVEVDPTRVVLPASPVRKESLHVLQVWRILRERLTDQEGRLLEGRLLEGMRSRRNSITVTSQLFPTFHLAFRLTIHPTVQMMLQCE